MQTVYRSGVVVSNPIPFEYNKQPDRSSSFGRVFGLNFATKRKIYDAAHIQAMELSNSGADYPKQIANELDNHVFLTPTFDLKNPESYLGDAANEAMIRFRKSLEKTYDVTSYVWVKEFTKELVPHYHMLLTMPYVKISDLNRTWSKARGDSKTVANALRTGWDHKRKRPVMKIRNYKQAVGYAAKYISKADSGDLTVLKPSVKITPDQNTWDYKTGHSTKCYGMSRNLKSEPRKVDFFLETARKPWLNRSVIDAKAEMCELFFIDNPQHAEQLYQLGVEKSETKKQKIEFVAPKKPNYSVSDQYDIEFSRKIRK